MAGLSREERMAFYINIYNQLVVRAPVLHLPGQHACTCAPDLHADLRA